MTVPPSPSSSLPDGSRTPAIAGDERRLLEGICGREWNGKTEAVLGVVDGSAEVDGVAGGELRGGGGYGAEVTFVLRWSPTEVG